MCQTGCQYTPVASIATCVTRCAASQSRNAIRPCTVVANSATCGWRRPAPSGTRTHPVTCALWTSSAPTRSKIVSISPPGSNTSQRRPAGPSKQTSLMVVLEATVRDPGEGPRTKLVTGAQAPKAKRRQRATPTSSPISPARGCPKGKTTSGKFGEEVDVIRRIFVVGQQLEPAERQPLGDVARDQQSRRGVGVPAGRAEIHDLGDPLAGGPAEVVLVERLLRELGDISLSTLEGPHRSSLHRTPGPRKGAGQKIPEPMG